MVLAFLGCRLYKHVELVIGHRKFVEGATTGVQDHPEFWEVVKLLYLGTMGILVLLIKIG